MCKYGPSRKVLGDEPELRELPNYMVFNANDAMPRGGRLTLSVEDADDSVVISIADSGSGMAAEISHVPSVLHHQGYGWDGPETCGWLRYH